MHIPVLPEKSLELWTSSDKDKRIKPGIYIDATFGGGGHSNYLLNKFPRNKEIVVVGIEWDKEQYQKLNVQYQKLIKEKKLFLFYDNYANLNKIVSSFQNKKQLPIRGVLFDFGFSTDQLEMTRGFSFKEPKALLDMRFNRENNGLTAGKILNTWPEEWLITIFKEYGEERYARRAAEAILNSRKNGKQLNTVGELLTILERILISPYRRQKIHYATRIFQALRMAVNNEKENIFQGLASARDILAEEGRLVAISFHSGEDRIVKNFFRRESRDCLCPPEIPVCRCGHQKTLNILTKKPIRPSVAEITINPNSRNARLRAAEKIQN
ncbi:MAG: 16S rRNA (cytosine(1402)-N(4))-methyltransferase RsmH [Candidatus Moranbacteria bacterium]|nr:16S rRNA (cytosine(1402)-N(4))-methyltransferase RsmH [Candidatus Moranbacteria bacterium]